MIISFKNRKLDVLKPIEIYRNLNSRKTGKVFSIRQSGLVVAHGFDFYVRDFDIKIGHVSRQRCLKNGIRNVHAYVKGYYSETGTCHDISVSYNPFKNDNFLDIEGNIVKSGKYMKFTKEGKAKI